MGYEKITNGKNKNKKQKVFIVAAVDILASFHTVT